MFNVLQLAGEVLKSNLVSSIINALIADAAVNAPNATISSTVTTAAANTNVSNAANAVVGSITPALKTWTPDELNAAKEAWASQQSPGELTANAAFAAGVAWCLAHQTSCLTTGIANAVAHTASSPVAQVVVTDVVQVAEAAVTGGKVAAAATAVEELAQAVEARRAAEQKPAAGAGIDPKQA